MDKRTKKFLKVISQIESSGGKNLNHRTLQEGMHAGDTAYGQYGLLPNTVMDVGRRLNSLHKADEDTAPLASLPKEQINPYLEQHPEAGQKVAEFLARNLLARNRGDESASAYMWNNGSSLQPQDLANRDIQNNTYVQKYRALQKLTRY